MVNKLSRVLVSVFLFALLITLLGANSPAPNPQEAARLNNIGVAYMNQQLFEKALKSFEAAAASDPTLGVTAVNRGVALLNLQRVDDACRNPLRTVGGLDAAQVRSEGANLFHISGGRVKRLVVYFNRETAFADLGLTSEADAADPPG